MEVDKDIVNYYTVERRKWADPNADCFTFLHKYFTCTSLNDYGLDPTDEIAVSNFFGSLSTLEVDLAILPAQKCILDHVLNSCKIEENLTRTNYLRAISSTLTHLNKCRNITRNTRLHVRTLVLGVSEKDQITLFTHCLTEHVKFLSQGKLWLPVECLALNVEYTSGIFKGSFSSRLPARISLGSWSERFDIVVPWKVTKSSDGVEVLSLDLHDLLSDEWRKIFALSGYITGINIHEDIRNVENFLRQLKFRNWKGIIKTKALDLCTILALSGYNAPADYTHLAFTFTGTVFYDFPSYANGYGKYHSQIIPDHLNICIQSKILIVMNSYLIATIVVMMNLFPTPSIASLVTKKSFPKFSSWFVDFLNKITYGAILDPVVFMSNSSRLPKDRILLIDTQQGLLSPSQFSHLSPPWSNVSSSGCPTDCIAITYLLLFVVDLSYTPGLPDFLNLHTNKKLLSGIFNNPTGKSVLPGSLGCKLDQSVPNIEVNISSLPVSQVLKAFRNSQPNSSPIKKLSNQQLLLLFTWTNQEMSFLLYAKTIDDYQIKSLFKEIQDDDDNCRFYFPEEIVSLDYLFSFLSISLPNIGDQGQVKSMKIKKMLKKEIDRNKRLLESEVSPNTTKKLKFSNKKIKKLSSSMITADYTTTEVELEIFAPDLSAEELMSCKYF